MHVVNDRQSEPIPSTLRCVSDLSDAIGERPVQKLREAYFIEVHDFQTLARVMGGQHGVPSKKQKVVFLRFWRRWQNYKLSYIYH